MNVAWIGGSHVPVAIVGGGQAGLSMSYCLRERDIDHIVIEAGRLGQEWRERRWDSFCLVTPNWQCKLPGFPYAGPDPNGFMNRAQVARYLEDYAASFQPPVAEGVSVTRLRRHPQGVYELSTTAGVVTADQVVVATGPYHHPAIPRSADRLPSAITQLHSSGYRNPAQLPDGEVLVVGSGQSGCQIAEELHLAGRQVHLAVGSAPRIARFYRGRDCVAWLDEMGHYAKGIDAFTDADAVRLRANHYVSGRDGGHDIDLRAFARDGMRLYGRLIGIDGRRLAFAGDLKSNLDSADMVAENIKDAIDAYVAAQHIAAPTEARYTPVWEPREPCHGLNLEATGITTVIWSMGFVRDDRWIEAPVFDGRGHPKHWRGMTESLGLYFVGQVWQSTWGSGRFEGVGRDARFVAELIDAARRRAGAAQNPAAASTTPAQSSTESEERNGMFDRLRGRNQPATIPQQQIRAPRMEPYPDRRDTMVASLPELERQSLREIPHPSLPEGSNIYGSTKVFPDYRAEHGECYFTLVHGIAHESSVSFVAVLQATRALRKGFEAVVYFYGPGSLNCLATRGFPTTGNSAFPGEHNINNQLKTFIAEGGKVYCCRFGLSLHGAREEDLIEGVIPTHPLDVQDALIHYARRGAIINSTYQL